MESRLTGRALIAGIKKAPSGGPAYRAWVLSPDGYTILPMRLPTTTRTNAVFMT
jgi:hypothetical protein